MFFIIFKEEGRIMKQNQINKINKNKLILTLKKVVAAEKVNELNFGLLNRKIPTLSLILNDLKKATQSKVENDAVHELYNLKREFDALLEELKVS